MLLSQWGGLTWKMELEVRWPWWNRVSCGFSALGLSFPIWEMGIDPGTQLTELLRELRQERSNAQHTGCVGPRLREDWGLFLFLLPTSLIPNHSCSRSWGFQGEVPTPPLTSSPPLLAGRARARGTDKGAGCWPGARPGGPSSPPIHGRGSA